MNDVKFFDQDHKLLNIESGFPRKYGAYKVPGATYYQVKVQDNGYMLFQHIPGKIWNIWISHYLFNKNTTVYCQGLNEGVEFHNILEGSALYKNGGEDWQHFKAGDHNVLYSPKINSIGKFHDDSLMTFDIHLSTANFKSLVKNQTEFKNWVTYFNSGINTKLYQDAAKRNLPLQAMLTQIIDKCKQHVFDANGNQELLGEFLDSVLENKNYKCDYRFSFEEVRRLIEAKEKLKTDPANGGPIATLYKDSMMGHKKFTEGFKLVFGVVPSLYLLTEKIKVCKSLMVQQQHLTNEDYAIIMNFNSGSHFARTFKNIEGCTPKEFRRKHGVANQS